MRRAAGRRGGWRVQQVGEALVNSGVPRSEVFVETKIWISDYGHDETLHGFDKSAGKLGPPRG
jgi:diketogulonate reductase-like aldo/keto reductase